MDKPSSTSNFPPIIHGHRPDLYAETNDILILGEAKPPRDLESARTERQLKTFMQYVEEKKSRHLLLAVHWSTAATANAVLRNLAHNWRDVRDRIHILDGINELTLPD